MLKYFLIIIFTQVVVYSASGQLKNIDSLKKALPYLHDSARVDCLNEIVYYFFQISEKDSIEHYLPLEYNEAKKLNYAHGIAVSFFQMAADYSFHNNHTEAEKTSKQSLYWYALTNNKKYIEIAYNELGVAFWNQSMYDEAITNFQQSYEWAKKADPYLWTCNALDFMGQVYCESGKYDSAFYKYKQTLELTQRYNDVFGTSESYTQMGDLYGAIEDYKTALMYYSKAFKIREKKYISVWDYTNYAGLFSLTNQYDSALYYYQSFDSASADTNDLRVFVTGKGEYFLLQKKYNVALEYFLKGLEMNLHANDPHLIERTLIDMAQTYAGKKNYATALQYAKQGLALALQNKSRQHTEDGYKILYAIYDSVHNTDSAYFYYIKYVNINNIMLSEQLKVKLAAYNYEQKISLLNEQEQLQNQQLKQSTQQNTFLIIGIISVLMLSFIIVRNVSLKRKNEKNSRELAENELQLQKLQSQQQLSELEMQTLRSQMNPHFIFNCLSSINRFILKNKTEEASDYLTKFSRLIRMVLNNSRQSFISLEDELETLRLYLEMERLRFKNSFDYSFTYNNSVEAGSIFIPPLLLQPFAENAIWHGLMNKQDNGFLNFDFSVEEKLLICIITDNGVGRERAKLLKSKSAEKQKSMGLKITTERLSLLNNNSSQQTFFTIEDLTDENGNAIGTRVHLKISYKEMMEV
jgi:tetratricopeptide (TPR) repeat protein